MAVLDNPRADRVRRMSGLVGRSARLRSGLILVEGPQTVRKPTAHRPNAMRDMYVREDVWEAHVDAADVARHATCQVYPVTVGVSTALSGNLRGICAVASLDVLSRELPEPSVGKTVVVLAQGRDPDNVDTIICTAGAFGAVDAMAVAGAVDVTNPKVVRSSTGPVFYIPVCVVPSFADARVLIHGRSMTLLGTSGGAASISLPDLLVQGMPARSRPFQSHAQIFGSEACGLPGDEIRLCDGLMFIPMTGDAGSLSMANTVAICLFTSQTARSVGN